MPVLQARVSYDSYTYNYWLNPVPSPHPFVPTEEVDGADLGIGEFDNPSDLFTSRDGTIYIADTNNHRIVWFDQDFNLIGEINTFNSGDTFNTPQGIFVTEENHIYVADTENQRVVHFDENGTFIQEFNTPVTDLISSTTSFRPTKLAVDKAGRIYALAIGINSGVVEINPDGTFQGFMGATEVSVNPIEYIWRRYFATQEQRRRMELILPTEYNNIYLDNEEFLYVTRANVSGSGASSTEVIRRLNPTGVNVLRDFGYGPPIGDYFSPNNPDITRFNDVTVTDYQVYTALDGENGKLFSYDYDGNLLYVFGSNGNRFGNFKNAVAVDQFEEQLFVLDNQKNSIIVFEMTEYGYLVNDAIRLHFDGHYEEVPKRWEEVLTLNTNADIAYIGLGKAQLRNDQYEEAMENLRLAHDRNNYTKAFEHYRRELLIDYFPTIMTIGLSLLVVIVAIRFVIKLRKKWEIKEVGE